MVTTAARSRISEMNSCEQLLGQVFNYGVESHDHLCDALVWLLQGLVPASYVRVKF